jgi:hypothetical protein
MTLPFSLVPLNAVIFLRDASLQLWKSARKRFTHTRETILATGFVFIFTSIQVACHIPVKPCRI